MCFLVVTTKQILSKCSVPAYVGNCFHPRGMGKKGSKYLVNMFVELKESSDHGKDFIH